MLKDILTSRKESLRPTESNEVTGHAHHQGHSKNAYSGLETPFGERSHTRILAKPWIAAPPRPAPAFADPIVTVQHQEGQIAESNKTREAKATYLTSPFLQEPKMEGPEIGIALGSPPPNDPSTPHLNRNTQVFRKDSATPPPAEYLSMASTSAAAIRSKAGRWRGLGGFLRKEHSHISCSTTNYSGERKSMARVQRHSSRHLGLWSAHRNLLETEILARPHAQPRPGARSTQSFIGKEQVLPVNQPLRRKLSKARQGERRRYKKGSARYTIKNSPSLASVQPSSLNAVVPNNLEFLKENDELSQVRKPLLEIEIPNVEMERYSIMFGNLLSQSRPTSVTIRRHSQLATAKMQDQMLPVMQTQSSTNMERQTLGNAVCLKQLGDRAVNFPLTEKSRDSSPSVAGQLIFALHGASSESHMTNETEVPERSLGKPMLPQQHVLRRSPDISSQRYEAVSLGLSPEQLPVHKVSIRSPSTLNDNGTSALRPLEPLGLPSASNPENVKKAAEKSIARQISVSQRQRDRLGAVMPIRAMRNPTPKPTH